MKPFRGNHAVLSYSLLISAMFILWGVFFNESLSKLGSSLLKSILDSFGWFYLVAAGLFLLFTIFLMISRYGNIRLGNDQDQPEYSTLSWIAMLYSAGMGVGLVFWGVAEPLSHYIHPPMGTGKTVQAAEMAMQYTFFHWGLHPWAIYTVVGLSLAYFQFRKGMPALISSAFYPLLGNKLYGPIGKTVDVLAVFATVFGVATSLGLGTMQIAGGLKHVLGVSSSTTVQVLIIAMLNALYITSATTGLNRGIKILSNLNILLAFALMVLLMAVGPTAHIFQIFTTSLGSYLNDIVSMSMRLKPFEEDTWISGWTLFYWAWWIAWAPFVGTFIARISRGRTIREFVMGVLVVPTLGTFLWFSAFGGSSLYLVHQLGHASLADHAVKDVTTALFEFFQYFPLSPLMIVLSLVLIITFFVTSADSATFVLGMLTSGGSLHPRTGIKMAWGMIQSGTAVVLLLSNSLSALQTVSIVAALPFCLVMVLMCYSFLKGLQQERTFTENNKDRKIG